MGAAALPAGAGQRGADRRDQAGVGIGDDQLDPGQAASDQPAQQRQPAGAILAGGDVEAEDLPVPVGVDPGRDERVHVHHLGVLADLDPQRIDPAEGVWCAVPKLDARL